MHRLIALLKVKSFRFYVDILEAVGEQLSWEIEYQVVPFARALRNMKLGRADVMLGGVPLKGRVHGFLHSAFPPKISLSYIKCG